MVLLCNKFGNGLVGLIMLPFDNPDFIWVKRSPDKIVQMLCKLGLGSSCRKHGSKRQHGLQHVRYLLFNITIQSYPCSWVSSDETVYIHLLALNNRMCPSYILPFTFLTTLRVNSLLIGKKKSQNYLRS